ncbi:MAG: 5-formyltetrahydrofolate cyclo-ligase [Steroidobacteraceae bacterium]
MTDIAALRTRLRQRRAAVSPTDRADAGRRIAHCLRGLHLLRPRARIAVYLPTPTEVDCWPTILAAQRNGCALYAPVISDYAHRRMRLCPLHPPLSTNRYGIDEPADADWLDPRWCQVILLPLLGFDQLGNRLGMGAGYYDRLLRFRALRRRWRGPLLIGLGYEAQRCPALTPKTHDIQLDAVVTESGIRRFWR